VVHTLPGAMMWAMGGGGEVQEQRLDDEMKSEEKCQVFPAAVGCSSSSILHTSLVRSRLVHIFSFAFLSMYYISLPG
jgi:hypothetical protein